MNDDTQQDQASPPTAAPAPPNPPVPPKTWRAPTRHKAMTALVVVIALAAVLIILNVWQLAPFGGGAEATANAYVRGRVAVIAPQVSGYVTEVAVHDYEKVNAQQVLVRIDDRIYRARVEQAKANLDAQLTTLANSIQAKASRTAGLQGQSAALVGAQAQLFRAQADMDRAEDLVKDGSISIREREQILAALRQAEAQVKQAQAGGEIARQDVRTVDVGRGGLEAQVNAARAQLHLAEIDLANTLIRAPEAGQVGEIGVRLGQYVTNGTQLLSLVPPERWVIANFKEAQTGCMAPGQKVSFSVDALGGALLTGHIDRLAPATGAEFSVIKPDNGTGNFVKVPQRIGVRIGIDPNQEASARLRPGMSVEAKVAPCGS